MKCIECNKLITRGSKSGLCRSCCKLEKNLSIETRKKMSKAQKGRKHTIETKRKIGKGNKGKKLSIETKRKIGKGNKGKKLSIETKRKISKKLSEKRKGEKNTYYGKKHSIETRKKMSSAQKGEKNHFYGKTHSKEIKKKLSEAMIACWKDKEFQEKMKLSFNISPNKPESYLLLLLNTWFPNEYKFVGDFDTFIGGKCPDFININGEKKLIELYGNYWHKNDNPQDRIDHFKRYGFDTLVIWEHELKDVGKLKNRLISFSGGDFFVDIKDQYYL